MSSKEGKMMHDSAESDLMIIQE
jgi:hypothetical protein